MRTQITRAQALALLQKYNREPFHIFHGLTVESTMRYFAREMGEDEDFWGLVGLLHDVARRNQAHNESLRFRQEQGRSC